MHAAGRSIEQDVHEVVGKQIDLVDVENTAIRRCEQPGLKGTLAS